MLKEKVKIEQYPPIVIADEMSVLRVSHIRVDFQRIEMIGQVDHCCRQPNRMFGVDLACAGSHFIGTVLREQGHQVRLIPAQFVKPYRKSNKNDFIDREAIREMPIWGPIFHEVKSDQDWGEVRLDAISKHIASIQQK